MEFSLRVKFSTVEPHTAAPSRPFPSGSVEVKLFAGEVYHVKRAGSKRAWTMVAQAANCRRGTSNIFPESVYARAEQSQLWEKGHYKLRLVVVARCMHQLSDCSW